MKLEDITTKNFHYSEFFYSKTAKEKNINNTTSNNAILKNLTYTSSQLQKVRDFLERPIFITSGYRCEYLNKLVGGSVNSYHLIGQAVDFVCPSFSNNPNDIIKAIKESDIEVDQCIAEFTKNSQWVHISFLKKPRNSFLIYDKGVYRKLD